jgi:hypothetical protein
MTVFSCATSRSDIYCDSSDLLHSLATLASSVDYNRQRIVLKCDWLERFAMLGAPDEDPGGVSTSDGGSSPHNVMRRPRTASPVKGLIKLRDTG